MPHPSFPTSNYSPNGYIDNPYHTRNLHPSGVIRTSHRLGIGWWFPAGRIDDGDNLGAEYVSNLELAFRVGSKVIATREDCDQPGVTLTSRYHSKNILSYDLDIDGVSISAEFYLNTENSLICLLQTHNAARTTRRVRIHATNYFHMIRRKWWGSDGIAGYYVPEHDAIVQTIWAYGHQFALGSNGRSAVHSFAKSEEDWLHQVRSGKPANENGLSARRAEPMFGTLTYDLRLDAGESRKLTLCLARGLNSKAALDELRQALKSAALVRRDRIAEDDAFWSACPMLTGDWPDHWKHGWVYDFETQRMNSRPPIGIYKHRWDAMQVHEPRVVLAETAIDSLTLSYGDMEAAKDELLGVFADAPYPNVPCTREDGSMNMIAADGSECGTAPSWCFPFHAIHSVYCRTRDRQWLAELYPHLCAFIDWWFANRTDGAGWFHCKCSWESGQDGSKRFLIEGDPGAVSEYVRTVDVEASVAEALANLALYAAELGNDKDARKWRKMARYRAEKTREMFIDGWYRDIDARSGKPIILADYIDIMMMAPVTCGVATQDQIAALAPKFDYFRRNQRFWLEWPSFVFPFSEAAWYAGHREFISEALYEIADRIYARIDRPTPWVNAEGKNRPDYMVPGVSREFWQLGDKEPPGGTENYGWGASMPMNIIRSLIGFREDQDPSAGAFVIAPTLPKAMLVQGRTYGVTNLTYRGVSVDLELAVLPKSRLEIGVSYRAEAPVRMRAAGDDGVRVAASRRASRGKLKLTGPNGAVYRVTVE